MYGRIRSFNDDAIDDAMMTRLKPKPNQTHFGFWFLVFVFVYFTSSTTNHIQPKQPTN